MVLDNIELPIVLAPLAGGPCTPQLVAAVSAAGGLGFLAGGYLSAPELAVRLAETRSLTDAPVAVNIFAAVAGPARRQDHASFEQNLAAWAEGRGLELGEPRFSDDDWKAKLDLLLADPVPVVSFTFGCPERSVIEALKQAGSEIWVTVTSTEEADHAAAAGVDCLVVQGAEAGGHPASFVDVPDLPSHGLLPLIALIQQTVSVPLIASGGIATGAAVAAVLCAGARAAQVGTAFMLSSEAGTSKAHREAISQRRDTVLNRAFTGRLARGIKNRFTTEQSPSAPIAYPEIHYLTAPMRKRARETGDGELINLWAGEAHELTLELPAATIAKRLAADADAALLAAGLQVRRKTTSQTARSGPIVNFSALSDLARAWYAAWNAHDLDEILSHYADEIVFTSPFIAALGSDPSSTLRGKPALRGYWTTALERYPELHFEPLRTLYGVGSVTLHYRGVSGVLAAEVLEVSSDRRIVRAAAHYDRMP